MRTIALSTTFLQLAAVSFAAASVMAATGCESCADNPKRSFGATCGAAGECAGGICLGGLCTSTCGAGGSCAAGLCIVGHCHPATGDMDGDGLSNERELELKTRPDHTDSDGDGISDGLEASATAANDRNKDGVIDALQSDIIDSDGDCMVDAWDNKPLQASGVQLPDAAVFCNEGICAHPGVVAAVVCRKQTPTHARVVLGCLGCGCVLTHANGQPFEAVETTCDGLDNDCDGLTDESLVFDGNPLGSLCVAKHGICAAPTSTGASLAGIVECGVSGKAVCSVGLAGSKSPARTETCNQLDDDCDGAVDEGFDDGGKAVGQPCGPCGASLHVCEDGSTANPPTVRCSTAGDSAGCSGVPFDDKFQAASAGAPPGQRAWTASWSPKWQRLAVYGGEIATVNGVVTSHDLWLLTTASNNPRSWQRSPAQPPGKRHGAAFVWDADGDRMLLIGGKNGPNAAPNVWALDANSNWSDVSAQATQTTANYVPPLPLKQTSSRTAAVVVGDAKHRWLVLFARGHVQPAAVELSGPPNARKWFDVALPKPQPGAAKLSGTIACAATRSADQRDALVLATGAIGTKIGVYRITGSAKGLLLIALATSGLGPARADFACMLDSNDTLHAFGGHAFGQGTNASAAHFMAKAEGSPFAAGGLAWQAASDMPASVARESAFAGWDVINKRAIVGGGHTVPSAGAIYGLSDVVAWAPGSSKIDSLSKAVPPARVGQAVAFDSKHGFCMGGGVRFSLPGQASAAASMWPATGVWCFNDGTWQRVSNGLAPFAFGAAAIDRQSGRMVFVGGLKLAASSEVTDLHRIWQAKLSFADDGSGTSPKVNSAVQSVHLESGVVQTHGKGPALAAMASAHDAKGRRLLTFGGFNNTNPTLEMWRLDLGAMKWALISGKWPGGNSPGGGKPLAQYGSMMAYSRVNATVLLVPGLQFQRSAKTKKWSLTFQILNPPAGQTYVINACRGDRKTLMWLATVDGLPTIKPAIVPTFADLERAKPQVPLYQPHHGQPGFGPIIFDTTGERGITLLPPARRYSAKDAAGSVCPGPSQPAWTRAERPLHVNIGRCDGGPRVFVSTKPLATVPDAWILAGAAYDDLQRRGWVWGGLRADGSPSTALWSIGQPCKAVVP